MISLIGKRKLKKQGSRLIRPLSLVLEYSDCSEKCKLMTSKCTIRGKIACHWLAARIRRPARRGGQALSQVGDSFLGQAAHS
jgi:hypothetical protein